MQNNTLEKSIILAEASYLNKGLTIHPFHQDGKILVLDGVRNERDALVIISTLDDNGETMTLKWEEITGLAGRGTMNPRILPPGQSNDVGYDPKKQELHINSAAVRESNVQNFVAGERLGVTAIAPYIRVATGLTGIDQLAQTFGAIAGKVPGNARWLEVQELSANDSSLASSVKNVEDIFRKSGLEQDFQRVMQPFMGRTPSAAAAVGKTIESAYIEAKVGNLSRARG